MKKILMFSYSIVSYGIAFVSLLLWIISISNLVPEISIDRMPEMATWKALFINFCLIGLFGLHHSIAARSKSKEWIVRVIPAPVERSTFVLISGVLLAFMVVNWQPIGGIIWSFTPGSVLYYVSYMLFFAGWIILFVSTFIINHFDLFGLRQTYLELVGKPYTPLEFKESFLYQHVRHPLYFGGILGLWATPTMSATHLTFALLLTAYFVIGAIFEERDLIRNFGKEYREYQKKVPMLIPLKLLKTKATETSLEG